MTLWNKVLRVFGFAAIALALVLWLAPMFKKPARNDEPARVAIPLTPPTASIPQSPATIAGAPLDGQRSPPQLTLPDGSTVTLRIRHGDPMEPPEGPLVEVYPELANRAENGDHAAAMQLWMGTLSCRGAHRDRESLDEAIRNLRETGVYTTPGSDGFTGHMPDPEAGVQALTENYERCRDLTDEQLVSDRSWIEGAANAGYPPAKHLLAGYLMRESEAVALAEDAWRAGHYEALQTLAQIYYGDADGNSYSVPIDRVRSYANLYLFLELSYAVYGIPRQALVDDLLEERAGELSPREYDEAMRLVREIYELGDCCVVY